jgi:hypothetical protein
MRGPGRRVPAGRVYSRALRALGVVPRRHPSRAGRAGGGAGFGRGILTQGRKGAKRRKGSRHGRTARLATENAENQSEYIPASVRPLRSLRSFAAIGPISSAAQSLRIFDRRYRRSAQVKAADRIVRGNRSGLQLARPWRAWLDLCALALKRIALGSPATGRASPTSPKRFLRRAWRRCGGCRWRRR